MIKNNLLPLWLTVKAWAFSNWSFLKLLAGKFKEPDAVRAIGQELALSYRANPRGYIMGLTSSVLVLLVLIFFLTSPRLTAHNLAKIKTGMTPTQVKALIGSPDESKTQGALGLTGTTYVYHHNKSDIKIVFLNDHVMAKQGEL